MPVYEYLCRDCQQAFEEVLTFTEYEKDEVVCPKCGSKNVEQEPASFFAVSEKKS